MLPSATRVHNPNGIWIGSAVFAWLTTVRDNTPTDKLTDHATPSVTIGRIYVRNRPTAMRLSNNNTEIFDAQFHTKCALLKLRQKYV